MQGKALCIWKLRKQDEKKIQGKNRNNIQNEDFRKKTLVRNDCKDRGKKRRCCEKIMNPYMNEESQRNRRLRILLKKEKFLNIKQ